MRNSSPAAFVALCACALFAACGRVGDPRPPIIRMPEKVANFDVVQSAHDAVLTWTNPSKYVDNNPANDLGIVHVFENGAEIDAVQALGAGKKQSLRIDVSRKVGSTLRFTVQLVPKKGKPSAMSEVMQLKPVDVPGAPGPIRDVVDLNKIALDWDPPTVFPMLADGYLIQRSDWPSPRRVDAAHFDDVDYETGKTYTYSVTATRGSVPGAGVSTRQVVAKDERPPRKPIGVQVQMLSENLAFITWDDSMREPDWDHYVVYRSDRDTPVKDNLGVGATDDSTYVPGKGISYQIQSVDKAGNKSLKSDPAAAP